MATPSPGVSPKRLQGVPGSIRGVPGSIRGVPLSVHFRVIGDWDVPKRVQKLDPEIELLAFWGKKLKNIAFR